MACFFCSLLFHLSYLFSLCIIDRRWVNLCCLSWMLERVLFLFLLLFYFRLSLLIIIRSMILKSSSVNEISSFLFFSMTMRWCLWMYVLFWISLLCETACLLKRGHFTVYSRFKCMHLDRVVFLMRRIICLCIGHYVIDNRIDFFGL